MATAARDLRTALLADPAQAVGLPNALYTDPAALALERGRIFHATWLAVGHAADIGQPGDIVPVDAAGVPIVLLRDREGAVRAFHNVCGHRGLRLVDEPCRGKPTLLCPYHGWAYDLKGALRATPDFGGFGVRGSPGFDPKAHPLRPVRIAEAFGGLLFADLSGTAPTFEDWAAPLLSRWRPYRFDRLRHAQTERCAVEANWKLVAENFVDTLHLEWVHPQVAGYSKPEDHFDIIEAPAYGSGTRNALSPDPRAHAIPSFPDLPPDLANRGEFLFLYPNILLFLMPNQLFSIVLDPLAPDRTGERLDFAFVEGDESAATAAARDWWIDAWRHLNGQDFGMLRRLQQGRASPAFDGGCFSAVMDQVALAVQRRVAEDLAP
jgi:choline monooxygenase